MQPLGHYCETCELDIGDRYISNPHPERDAGFRRQAQDRYYQLLNWLEKADPFTLQNLYLRTISFGRTVDGPFQTGLVLPWYLVDAEASRFEHPLRHLNIVFLGEHSETRKGGFVTGQVSVNGKTTSYIFLYQTLDRSGQIEGLLSRLRTKENRSTFIHEYIHFLDSQRYKKPFKHVSSETSNISDYYLSPVEFNAYYLQGFHELEEDFNDRMLKMTPESMKAWLQRSYEAGFLRDSALKIENSLISSAKLLSWDEILFNLHHWSYGFIKHLERDPKMWKRFLKRLRMDYETWAEPHQARIWQFEDLLEKSVLELTGKDILALKYEN